MICNFRLNGRCRTVRIYAWLRCMINSRLKFIFILLLLTVSFCYHAEAQKKKSAKPKEEVPAIVAQDSVPAFVENIDSVPAIDTATIVLTDTGAVVKTKKFMTGADQVKAY